MNLHITCTPMQTHFGDFCNDTKIAGIRMNGLLFKNCDLETQLNKIPWNASVLLWFDAKGRQMRVEKSESFEDHLELEMNHPISGLKLPHPIIFKAGEDWAMIERISNDGKRLILRADGFPKYRVKPGDSVHFRNESLSVDGPLFTDDEKSKIEMAVRAGAKNWYLSYVENRYDIDEFRELIGTHADLILKIENRKGLAFVERQTDWKSSFRRTRLACARGDLYVELNQPHEILAAQQTIIRTDPNAVVGSRMLLSLFNNNVPSCSDVNEMGLLSWMGYRNFLLCDDLCTSGPALHRAVDTFHSILP